MRLFFATIIIFFFPIKYLQELERRILWSSCRDMQLLVKHNIRPLGKVYQWIFRDIEIDFSWPCIILNEEMQLRGYQGKPFLKKKNDRSNNY